MRLCTVDQNRVIVRCFYGEERDHPQALPAPETWALEGLNYDQAKADYEARLVAEQVEVQRLDTIVKDAAYVDIIDRLRAATPAQINNYVDANVNDIASARALFKRILLVLSFLVKQ